MATSVVLTGAGGTAFTLMSHDRDMAVERCQAAIEDKLRSPSTARYGDATVKSTGGEFGTRYNIAGKLDAQNGFGIVTRGEYRCDLTKERNGSWVVTEAAVDLD